jgi:hypothetical protein
VTHFNAENMLDIRMHIERCMKPCKTGEVIDPQSDGEAVLMRKLTREPPAHTDVAKVVDDPAKKIEMLNRNLPKKTFPDRKAEQK